MSEEPLYRVSVTELAPRDMSKVVPIHLQDVMSITPLTFRVKLNFSGCS